MAVLELRTGEKRVTKLSFPEPEEPKTEQVNLRLPESLVRRVAAVAAARTKVTGKKVTASEIIRYFVEWGLGEYEAEFGKPPGRH